MLLLTIFSFIAGFVTILSPCILPVLPIILSGSFGGTTSKSKPLGIIFGFILSFTFFTLLLSSLVRTFGLPAELLRTISIFVIVLFGVTFLIPKVQVWLEQIFSKLSVLTPNTTSAGFAGGVVLGVSLGLLWSPCVGPILASVITLAITGTVNFESFVITLAYSVGTAIPMLLIMSGGQNLMNRFSFIKRNTSNIQKAFGVLMILTGVALATNADRKFQAFIITKFPNYGTGLTKIEDTPIVRTLLDKDMGSGLDISGTDQTKESELENSALPKYAKAPEITSGGQWFNTDPTTLTKLRGKVVLIDFWTYSCINCQRTLPYLRDWWEKYEDKGLVIIGVHSPEFEFEKDPKNVQMAINDFSLKYPVMQDNNFTTWRSYENRYWPAKYLIDKDGYIRYYHFGEGNYAETEKAIQELLKETGVTDMTKDFKEQDYKVSSATPETYLGHLRLSTLQSPERIFKNTFSSYTKPTDLSTNNYALEGQWAIYDEYAEAKPGSSLYINFSSTQVYLVMQSSDGKPAQVRVYIDGEQQFFGDDNKDGVVMVDVAKLYKLVKLPSQSRHILRLEFIDGNVKAFAFTFG